jgi:serine protease inhibitor
LQKYSSLEFRNNLLSLIQEVNEAREQAELNNQHYLEIQTKERVKEPYVSMIRDYFISIGYNVFFVKKLDITPYFNRYEISLMRLEW